MPWGYAAAIGGSYLSAKGQKDAAEAAAEGGKMDPRIAGMLFGQNGSPGLLDQYKGMLDKPQDPRLQTFGNANLDYLSAAGAGNNNAIQNAAMGLLGGTIGRTDLPAYAVGNMVQAPKQNSLDLTSSYNSLINGPPGANPYLTAGIQGGIDQSQNAFNQMQRQATNNLQRNVLGGIRSNAVLAGQYGGSRQGVAEGNAISDFTQQQQDAMNQFGQNNTNAATQAQLNAYNADRDRQLAATQGLGAQQYGVAQQNALTKNQAEFMNVNNLFDTGKFNAAAGLAGAQAGAGLLSGLTGNAYGAGQNYDNYALNQAKQVNSLLSPYLGQVPNTPQAYPGSTAGAALGGAMAGLGLYNQFSGGGGGGAPQSWGSITSGYNAGTGY
jgi:hypothetical protein